jgi:hypothetical protein
MKSELFEVYSASIDEVPDLVTRDDLHEILMGDMAVKKAKRLNEALS